MALNEEIAEARRNIKSDSYSISVGELLNQFGEEELIIDPEFQRLYRWSSRQKSRLIESLILGIPLPSIFVMADESYRWELIDGVQRVSTILEFFGMLPDPNGGVKPPLVLNGTEYLPSLKGKTSSGETRDVLDASITRSIRRAKIPVTILLPESDVRARGELFDRLNAGGSQATPQEIRFSRLVMEDRTFGKWLTELSAYGAYKSITPISDRRHNEGYDVELVCRFFSIYCATSEELQSIDNIDEFMTAVMLEILEKSASEEDLTVSGTFQRPQLRDDISLARANLAEVFRDVCDVLDSATGEESFLMYKTEKNAFQGPFLVSAYEAIMFGIAENISLWKSALNDREFSEKLTVKIRNFSGQEEYRSASGSGRAARERIRRTLPFASRYFSSVN